MFNQQSQPQTPTHVITPSQWVNFGWLTMVPATYFVHPYACALAVVIFIYKYFDVDYWRYEFYDDCVIERRGVFNVTRESVNYFRIKSIMIDEPFWMRLLGLSVVRVMTSEQYKPVIEFYAIGNSQGVKQYLDHVTRQSRKEMGIRDFDVYGTHY